MVLKLDELMALYPKQIWIELLPQEQEKVWQQIQQQEYSNAAARWNAYLNYLCLNSFLNWVQEDSELKENLQLWSDETSLPSFWEVVTGTKLSLDKTQLVLIPTDKSYFPEFRIPQEWIDIPNWAANYYLAVQLNLNERWMQVLGYATHEQIKKEGMYDRIDRTYSLDREDLKEDLNVMWVAQELFPAKQLEIQPLPDLETLQTKMLLEQLSQPSNYSPRLSVIFEQWAAIIANDETRQQLYRKRLLNHHVENSNFLQNQADEPKIHNLSLWLQNIFEAGWQSIDTLLNTEQTTLAFQFRNDSVLSQVPVKGAKLIDLGIELKGAAVMLLVGITQEIDDKVGIRVQLYPGNGETYLPANIELSLLSELGVMLQEVRSRNHDNYIQLKRFKAPQGKPFSIQVMLGNASIKEDFVFYQSSLG
ncbi:hypothetical protein NIES2119_25550 [[Phormidium ambiguum] IAM M-71]|uniref:DUF1822 domain-containing protein n=1 Tax=[Phormidium ambiguum] IAM M-71 TaxID=454136 RepID=A0A1U7I868_9CYAN|nr:DUF1822 family protein [Phormidium ambiguum]OKH32650.1 hypothetical protein NIES2119_25550 [Phormidium ambiguum IAM M-71]